MNGPARRFVVLVLAILVIAGWLIEQRPTETFAIMRDQSQHAKLIAMLAPLLAKDAENPALLATLARSYGEIGQKRRAAGLLERYVALRPDDADAYGELADLYKALGDPARRVARLERALAIRPLLSRALELGGVYRDQGRFAEERALLGRHEHELTLDSGLLLRLAQLREAAGDRAGAIRTLMRPEVLTASAAPTRPPAERFYLAELLLDAGRPADALAWGRRWIAQWHEPWRASQLLRRFAIHAPPPVTAELARVVASTHPDIRFYLAAELDRMGARAAAGGLLAGWAAANPAPSASEIAAFASACRAHGRPDLVWAAFGAVLARGGPDAVIRRFLDVIVAEFGIGAVAPFWSSLPPSVIAGNPLFGVRLALDAGEPALARRLLAALPPATLAVPDQHQWLALLAAAATPAEQFAILDDYHGRGALPRELGAGYLALALRLGHERAYRAALVAGPASAAGRFER